MSLVLFTVLVIAGSAAAGLLGALTGLGGGIVIIPMLTILFGVNIRYAIGASLVAVIATSSGAAAAFVREGYTNIRVGIFLEVATTLGALLGAAIAAYAPASALGILFGVVLLYTAYSSMGAHHEHLYTGPLDPWSKRLKLDSTYPGPEGPIPYSARRITLGFCLMLLAGVLSALLGIGSGVIKVLAMDRAMQLPFKVSTTTSNFMIGVTAAAGAGVYLHRGYIEPTIALPVMVGVLLGAGLGADLLTRAPTLALRRLFTVVVVVLALEMLYKGITGGL
ncbi:MAG TPA: sulfite exporter TauE/SafE family protein [Gemmatimonadales bacterium]|nr:sulfite exporter TauE/SafE family protein [Gemmatimonadales bacterium]